MTAWCGLMVRLGGKSYAFYASSFKNGLALKNIKPSKLPGDLVYKTLISLSKAPRQLGWLLSSFG